MSDYGITKLAEGQGVGFNFDALGPGDNKPQTREGWEEFLSNFRKTVVVVGAPFDALVPLALPTGFPPELRPRLAEFGWSKFVPEEGSKTAALARDDRAELLYRHRRLADDYAAHVKECSLSEEACLECGDLWSKLCATAASIRERGL